MREIANVPIYNPRAQCIVMLFAALAEMGRVCTKNETIEYIQGKRWFDIQPEDLEPYPTQTEPRWHTSIAFARKEAVETELMFDHPRDEWELARPGVDAFRRLEQDFAGGRIDVSRFYLWTPTFKRRFCPRWERSVGDAKRPRNLYRDAGHPMTRRVPGRDPVTRAMELLERFWNGS